MRKNFGRKTWLYPMPVLIVGSYDEKGVPNAMNAAWGGIYDTDQIMVCLAHDHKTTENILMVVISALLTGLDNIQKTKPKVMSEVGLEECFSLVKKA